MDELTAFSLANGYQFKFESEPDISVLDPDGLLVGAIEVKGGLDPAGALERYGAAKKSFDAAKAINKNCMTLYLSGAVTKEVEKRIADDRSVWKWVDLSQVLTDGRVRERFLQDVEWWVRR